MIKNILLLTATVTPPSDAKNLAHMDANVRRQEYMKSLTYYVSLLGEKAIDAIVFCENSLEDMGRIASGLSSDLARDRLELLTFDGLDYPASYGRGYGELKIIEYANQHSEIIKNNPQATVWKITGRYVVENLPRVILSKPQGVDLYCNFRNYPILWIDMYVLAWSARGYFELLSSASLKIIEREQGVSAEQLFRQYIELNSRGLKIQRRFLVQPTLVGVRGVDGKKYDGMKLKNYIRALAIKLFPWVWI